MDRYYVAAVFNKLQMGGREGVTIWWTSAGP